MVTVTDVAKELGKSPQSIRILLQRGLLPFGVATKLPGSSRWTYVIFDRKFDEYVGTLETR